MQSDKKNRLLLGQDNNALKWLVIINSVVFIALVFIKAIYYITGDNSVPISQGAFESEVLPWFTLSPTFDFFIKHPWTLFTYMFSQTHILGLISSLLWLWFFGYIFQDLVGNKRLIPLYLYGGLAGGVVFLLCCNFMPGYRTQISLIHPFEGAGVALMALAIATTTLTPSYRVFPMLNGGIPLWVLTLIFVVIDFATIGSSNGCIALAHLSGGAIGWFFIVRLRQGYDLSGWMVRFYHWGMNLFNPEKKYKKPQEQHFYKTEKKQPYKKTTHIITQEKIDELLDKISSKGYHFLTDEEKETLKKASQEEDIK
ncbi:MAG: rhomboid family intramembrane serine protease [Chitinophagaceae bacterium]|jgi:membrane associated rhomboid family serine protease|nr:rhomboid family intramembrane serine protease [Chitinophagaceae bacterium]